jgi:hypothetical protein
MRLQQSIYYYYYPLNIVLSIIFIYSIDLPLSSFDVVRIDPLGPSVVSIFLHATPPKAAVANIFLVG